MNNQQTQGGMPQGLQNGQGQPGQNPQFAQRQVPLFRPENMRSLPPQFTADEKTKWENGLQTLYNILESSDSTPQQVQEARKKVHDFSLTLNKKIQMLTRPNGTQQQQQPPLQHNNAGQSGPSNQAQQQTAQQMAGGAGSQTQQQPQRLQQNGQAKPKLSENLQKHLDNFKLVLPPNLQPDTPEAEKWIADNKTRYGTAMQIMEQGMLQLKQLEHLKTQRDQAGNPFNPDEMKDWAAKKMQVQKKYADAKAFSGGFRNQHQAANGPAQSAAGQPQQQAAQGGSMQNGPARPTLNLQQPSASSTSMQQNTQAVSAAFEAARNQQQVGGQRTSVSGQQQSDHAQMPNGQQGPAQPGQQNGANVKVEGASSQPAPINTAMAQAPHMQQRPVQNSPQTAGPPNSATSQGPPRPLTHQAALQQSARTYSQGAGGTPQTMGHAPSNMGRDSASLNSGKYINIPKALPPSATAPPQPVSMASARPTLSGGPNNSGNGMMSQPVMQKIPTFDIQAEGDRVMSKKKLDELVRQVTGGGEGLESGEGLTPEVEEAVLSVADGFVDSVIDAACKCAKARGSKTLEIRDIQLILERSYNMRIPGYASDEIRTVRKFQPAPGWIAKMSAIQAAKVTDGKGDL